MGLSCRLRGNGSNFPSAEPGAIAQLAERLDRTQEVGGSNPPSSISKRLQAPTFPLTAPGRAGRLPAVSQPRALLAKGGAGEEDEVGSAMGARRIRVERGIYRQPNRTASLRSAPAAPGGFIAAPQAATSTRPRSRGVDRGIGGQVGSGLADPVELREPWERRVPVAQVLLVPALEGFGAVADGVAVEVGHR
jgi:hypothetical protein